MSEGIGSVNNFDFASIGIGAPQQEEKKAGSELGKDAFMELLVAQVENQNPLDPDNDTDFIAQTAQFDSLDSLRSMEQLLTDFVAANNSDKALQASALVGKAVLTPSESAALSEGGMLVGVDVPIGVPDLKASVFNQQGELIKTMHFGSQAPGRFEFLWDGSLDDGEAFATPGIYNIKVEATVDRETAQLTTLSFNRVSSVVLDNGQGELTLNLGNGESVGLSKVIEITE